MLRCVDYSISSVYYYTLRYYLLPPLCCHSSLVQMSNKRFPAIREVSSLTPMIGMFESALRPGRIAEGIARVTSPESGLILRIFIIRIEPNVIVIIFTEFATLCRSLMNCSIFRIDVETISFDVIVHLSYYFHLRDSHPPAFASGRTPVAPDWANGIVVELLPHWGT